MIVWSLSDPEYLQLRNLFHWEIEVSNANFSPIEGDLISFRKL